MDPILPHPTSASSRAISIPLHNNDHVSSRHQSSQSSRRRAIKGRRPTNPERLDSDIGNASASSMGSDWAASPVTPPQSVDRSRAGIQIPDASSVTRGRTTLEHSISSGQRQRKDKQRAGSTDLPPNTLPPLFISSESPLGPSMLSTTAYKSVNLNSHHDPESNEPARLITYTKYSQGFTWNDELFLPSYLLGRHRYRGHGSSAARRRWSGDDDDDIGDFEEEGERCPVTDIFVTDEEAAAMMP